MAKMGRGGGGSNISRTSRTSNFKTPGRVQATPPSGKVRGERIQTHKPSGRVPGESLDTSGGRHPRVKGEKF